MADTPEKKYIEFVNPQTGQAVGYYREKDGKKEYITEREEIHYFRKFGGFGISEDVLNLLKEQGITDIYVVYLPRQDLYKTTVEKFETCGQWENIQNDNQRVMPLHMFEKPLGRILYTKVLDTLKQHVHLNDEEYHLLTLWVMHTYMVEYFHVTPYVQLVGPPGSGKSTIMRVCSLLVHNGRKGSFSAASIFRIPKGVMPTLFFNEFENIEDKSLLIEVLNNGYEIGEKVVRVLNDEPVEFDPFCPKMFGTVNKQYIPTLDTRCIEIKTFRSPRRLASLLGKDDELEQRFEKLRQELKNYMDANKKQITDLFRELQVPLEGRPGQIIRPLAAIEKHLGVEERVAQTYKKTLQGKLWKELHRNQAHLTMKLLYERNGKATMKELARALSEQWGEQRNERYVGGILDKLELRQYVSRTGFGYRVDMPIEVVLDYFRNYNMDKELLDSGKEKLHDEEHERNERQDQEHELHEPVPVQRERQSMFDILESMS